MLIKKILTVLLPFASVVAEGAGASPAFTVGSPDMADGKVARAQFANVMGGDGDNTSPRIEWHNAPANARSFVVTLYDPDAPTGSGWWHWAVANIPATANSLASGAGTNASLLPAGALQVNTDMGVPGYGGPLPPPGATHRYVITVTALDVPALDLAPTTTPALLAFMALGHTVGKASFTALGSR